MRRKEEVKKEGRKRGRRRKEKERERNYRNGEGHLTIKEDLQHLIEL